MNERGHGTGRAAWRRALPLALVMAAGATHAGAQDVRWTGTASYSRGSYVFDETTSTLGLSTGLGLTWGRLDVSGTLPVLLQNSQLVSQVGGVPLPTGGPDHEAVGRRGPGDTVGTRRGGGGTPTEVSYRDEFSWTVGDPFLSGSARLREGTGLIRSVNANVSTKAPLRGLDSGVGTGEWDLGAGASTVASLGGTFVFADLAYWWYGDLPELELADGLSYSVAVSRAVFGSRASVIASFLGAEPAIESMDRPASLGLGVSYMRGLGRSFSGGVMVGLSEASPDLALYAGWSLRVG